MKKVLNLKKVLIIMLVIGVFAINRAVFATDSILENTQSNESIEATATNTTDTTNEYANASTFPTDNNNTVTSTNSNNLLTDTGNTSNGVDTNSAYNNSVDDDEETIPQTGIEDYKVGILLVVCIGASIFTYTKMKEYKNV